MKIALVSRGYSLNFGGAEAVTVHLSRALSRGGFDVTVYAEKIDEALDKKGITVEKVNINRKFSLFRGLSFHKKISKMLKGHDYDVVFGFCPFYPVDIYRASGGVHAHWMSLRYPDNFKRALKYIFSPANFVIDSLESNMFKRSKLGRDRCRFVITNSILVKDHFEKYFGLKDDKVRVVYNGVDHSVFNKDLKKYRGEIREEFAISDSETVALYVSNNWKRKGLETVIKSMVGLKGLTLMVVGRGKESEFTDLVEKSGVDAGSIKFVGPRSDIEKFYGAGDFFVLPTQYDPCSNACLEAMASGLPVITTMENGASEFIAHEYDGYILESWQDVMLLQQFFYTLMDSQVSSNMGERAAAKIKDYTWERTMEETVKVCMKAIEESGKGKK